MLSPTPTSAASLLLNTRLLEMTNMVRNGHIIARPKTNEGDLGYMSDMALQLAQMAEDSGQATLAYLFRMAALEASNAHTVMADPDDPAQQETSH
jgi:hypothetical protein